MIRMDESSPRGSRAPCYWHREPALSLAHECQGSSAVFVSYFGPLNAFFDMPNATLDAGSWRARFEIDTHAGQLQRVELEGAFQETLAV